MEGGGQVDVVYTDFEKAFDRVDHVILLKKLKCLGIHGDLFRWVKSYLSNRSQAVVLGGHRSDYVSIPSGVPQGSLLGPLFYNAYIYDISNVLHNTHHLLYADDKKIFMRIRSNTDCLALQDSLNQLTEYYTRNKITLSITKCQCISFTRKLKPITFDYKFNNTVIERVHIVKDLGITLDSKMLMNNHVDDIVNRSYRNLGFVMRTCAPFNSVQSIKVAYYAYVRSILEYASPVWNPQYATYTSRIENIQKKFLHHLNYKFKNSAISYTESCSNYGLLKLEERRQMLDMGLLYDIITGKLDCPDLLSEIAFYIPARRSRRNIPPFFNVPIHSTNYGGNSVLTHLLRTYNVKFNHLDPFIVTKDKFKQKVRFVLGGSM